MLEVGTKAPDFTLPDQNGEMHSLSDYKGKSLSCTFIPRITRQGVQSRLAVFRKDIRSLWKRV